MKMFLLGLLVMWVAMNLVVWIADLIDEVDAIRKAVPLFYILSFIIVEAIPSFFCMAPLFPLCFRYRINPFHTRISTICVKLNTEKARAKWLSSKVWTEEDVKHWEKIFAKHPLS